jgi:hypothetical protein
MRPRGGESARSRVVLTALDEEGGPLISHDACEDQQRSFDATCRKLYHVLNVKDGNTGFP